MRVIKKHAKTIGKIFFVLILILIIIYTFKDSAGDILTQLKETSFLVIAGICIASVMYELVEGWISYSLAKVYNPDFKYWQGVECAFYAAFYRVATLGSGAGVAAIYYFNERGVPYSKGTGLYTIEYMLHKVSIALFAGIFFILNWGYMQKYYSQYDMTLLIGFGVTFVIAAVLLLFACSKKFHEVLLWIVRKLNRSGKLTEQVRTDRRMYPEKSVKVYILVWNPVFDISRDRKADTVTGTGSYLFGNDVSSSYSGTGRDRFFGVRTDNAVSKDRRNRSSRLRCTALSFCNFCIAVCHRSSCGSSVETGTQEYGKSSIKFKEFYFKQYYGSF